MKIGRSYIAPSFFISAGAMFTVILAVGYVNLQFFIEERTRSLLSLTAASGRPTMSNLGSHELISASTSTKKVSKPKIPKLLTFAYILIHRK